MTEGIFQDKSKYDEHCTKVLWDRYENSIVVISEVYSNELNGATIFKKGEIPCTDNINIAIRSLKVPGAILYWTKLIVNKCGNDSFAGASIESNKLIVSGNCNEGWAASIFLIDGSVSSTIYFKSDQIVSVKSQTPTLGGVGFLVTPFETLNITDNSASSIIGGSNNSRGAMIIFDTALAVLQYINIDPTDVEVPPVLLFEQFMVSTVDSPYSFGMILYNFTEILIESCTDMNCLTCIVNTSYCLSCANGYYLSNFHCKLTYNGFLINNKAADCNIRCSSCTGYSIDECTTIINCQTDYYRQNGQCVASCNPERCIILNSLHI
jgi:hypothetical protein